MRAEYDQIRDSIQHEHENAAKSYSELFKSKSSFRRLLLVCAIQASVQMTGVSAIQYYSPVSLSSKTAIQFRIATNRNLPGDL